MKKNYLRIKIEKLKEEIKILNVFISIAKISNNLNEVMDLEKKRSFKLIELGYITHSVK